MKDIVIFSCCQAIPLIKMLEKHPLVPKDFVVTHIQAHEAVKNKEISDEDREKIKNCDIFIYQPLQTQFDSEYLYEHVSKILKPEVRQIVLPMYRFKGFWPDLLPGPYKQFKEYTFDEVNEFGGLHESFRFYVSTSRDSIKKKLDSIDYDHQYYDSFYSEKMQELKLSCDMADELNMWDFIEDKIKHTHLFHDYLHPTNIFFYELFRRLVRAVWEVELAEEDEEFLKKCEEHDLTQWAQPIIPSIKKRLDMTTPDIIPVFVGDQKMYMDVYDYYYIRILPDNFINFLKQKNV